ncbi:hypothetical protein, partial [Fluviicola sp.]|uniref:hypothetical protein n=1 Tax=Fluviicola sp. TaxID=1917219 RepID=UPI0031D559E1
MPFSILFGQESNLSDSSIFHLGAVNIDLGANAGVQSNFLDKRGRMNHFVEVSTSFQYKNLPLTFQGRLSDEKYISGKPSYFRLSYDAAAKYRMRKAELEHEIGDLNTGIGDIDKNIYGLEGKLGYLDFLLQQYKAWKTKKDAATKAGLPDLNTPTIGMPDLNKPEVNLDKPDVKTPGLNGLKLPEKGAIDFDHLNLDSINQLISNYNLNIDQWSNKKDSLQQLKELKLSDLNALNLRKPNGFLDGIKRFDLGLTSLSGGKMSNSSVPIQGLRMKGTWRKYFYDAAA